MLQTCLQTFSKTCFKQKKSPDLSETCFRLVCNLSVMCRKWGSFTALSQTRWLDLRAPTCKERGGGGRGGKGRRDGGRLGKTGKGGEGQEGRRER